MIEKPPTERDGSGDREGPPLPWKTRTYLSPTRLRVTPARWFLTDNVVFDVRPELQPAALGKEATP